MTAQALAIHIKGCTAVCLSLMAFAGTCEVAALRSRALNVAYVYVCCLHRDQLVKLGLREMLNKLQMTSQGDNTLLRYIARAQQKLVSGGGAA